MHGSRKGSRYHRLDDIPKDSFTPRTYQTELLDSALKRNTVLCLGSGESKVFLALMVAKHLASITRLSLTAGGKRTFYLTDGDDETNAISTILPHHTDLSIGKFCSEHLNEPFSGQNGCTTFNIVKTAKIWQQIIEENSIIVTTGSLFMKALQNDYMNLQDVNLLIFDDCHKSVFVENHPYIDIVLMVTSMGKDQPHILGVTASIAGTDCNQPESLKETISKMEKSLSARAETSMLILSERFRCRPKEFFIGCQETDDDQPLLADHIEDILLYNLEFFEDCRISKDEDVDYRDPTEIPIKVLGECHNVLQILGSWCTASIGEYFIMQVDKIIKFEKNDIHKKFLRCVCTTLRRLTKFFEKNFRPEYDVEQFLQYTTPKVHEVAKILRKFKPEVDFMIINNDGPFENDGDFSDMSDNDDDDDSMMSGSDGGEENEQDKKSSMTKPLHIAVKRNADGGHERIMTFSEEEEKNLCGVIFVQNHFIAFGLNKLIEEICSWDDSLCFVKSSHIMGHGLRGVSSKVKSNKTYKRQEETLRKFRMQERNLIIATKELEEGIDIPKCNLVVCFDPPTDYRSYTLSKGRARARDASYYILLDEDGHSSFSSNLDVFKGIEQVLLGENRNLNSSESEDEETDVGITDNNVDYILPPYSSGYAQVDINGAISLINKYCAKLPSDAFTHLTPQCRVQKIPGCPPKYRAYLRLPINSPVKEELTGPEMFSRKLAERAVALTMCQILHEKGELDENLVPVRKELFLYEEEEEWTDEEDQTGHARPGTTKRKQYYVKKVADALMQSQPQPGKPCFLYLFNLRLTGRITDEQNTRGRVIYAPEDTTQTLGILLSKRIPQIPCFPIYTRSGEVTASVDLLDSGLILTEEEIDQLLKFHQFVFSGVLHLIKEPMEFSPSVADIGCVIVPLDGTENLHIDWDFVDKVITYSVNSKRAGFGKQNNTEKFEFRIDDFKDAVVMPSYRNIDQPQHFYVAEIRQDLNLISPFPSPELYKTFQDYYTIKYGLDISNPLQPLLDVDHTSARLNLLTPRYMNQKGVALPTSSAETKRARRENLQQKQILVPELCDVHVFNASLWRKTVCLPAILYRTNCLLLAEELRCKISRETAIGVDVLPEGFRFPKLDFGFETSPEKLKEAESSSDGKSMSSNSEKKEESSAESCNKSVNNSLHKVSESQKENDCHTSSSLFFPPTTHDSTNNICVDKKEKKDVNNIHLQLENVEKTSKQNHASEVSLSKQNGLDGNTCQLLQNCGNSEIVTSPSLKGDNVCGALTNECNTDIFVSANVMQQNDNMQVSLNSNCNSCASRQPTASSISPCTHHHCVSKDLSTLNSTSSNCLSTKEESVAQAPPSSKSFSTCLSNDIDSSVDSHNITSFSSLSSVANPMIKSANTNDQKSSVLRHDVASRNMKNGVRREEPPGAINNVVNNQVLFVTPSGPLQPNSSDVPSCFFCPSSLSSLSSSMPESPLAKSTSSQAAEITSLSNSCCSTAISSVMGYDAPNVQPISADSSKSSFSSLTAAADKVSGMSQGHDKYVIELLTDQHRAEGAPQNNCNLLPGNDPIISAYQGCEHEKELPHPLALNQTSHPLTGMQNSASQIICDKTRRPSDDKGNKPDTDRESCKPMDSSAIRNSSPNGIYTVNNDKSNKLFNITHGLGLDNGHTSSNNCIRNKKEQSGTGKNIMNGFCHEQREIFNDNEESFSYQKPNPPSPHCESAIIMNSLSAELNSELNIDLISPDMNTSATFQSCGNLGNVNQDMNKEWQQGNSFTKGCDQGEKPFQFEPFPQTPEHSTPNSNSDMHQINSANITKFSFSDYIPNKEENALVVDDWKYDKKEEKPFETEIFSSKQSESSNNSPEKSVEEETLHVENSNSTQPDSSSMFPISVWENEKVDDHASDEETTSEKDLQTLVITSASLSTMSLDEDRDLSTFIGPSPCLILQALTMSNANDFFSLERLETIGDSFLKYAITVYLYCSYPGIHEGRLSYLRSKQVSNYNLYRLGRRKNIADYMVSTKFEPYENWLPPGFSINNDRRRGPVPKVIIASSTSKISNAPRNFFVEEAVESTKQDESVQFNKELEWIRQMQEADQKDDLEDPDKAAIPYSLQCQHGLPDKSVADCVEALIGCYLTTCGRKAALMFMSWLGLKVLPKKLSQKVNKEKGRGVEISKSLFQRISEQEFDELQCPSSPMFFRTPENEAQLNRLLEGFDSLEEKLQYTFKDRSYLLQAFTHASYHYNTITDCYQRVEFLGDAILDYVITRHLYEDSQKYSPGILTDLRSALVNNNIFAALAVKWEFHCYFKAISPSLFAVIDKFVTKQKEKNQDDIDFDEEYQVLSMEEGDVEDGNEEDDSEEEVEMEIPKALGDIFESVAGAIYLDSCMSLDTVWRVYYRMMKPYIDKYLKSIPKSLVRELLEREPETAKFERPERTINGKVRVTVNVVGKGVYSGIGRNYRIAKSAAAKKALRALRSLS